MSGAGVPRWTSGSPMKNGRHFFGKHADLRTRRDDDGKGIIDDHLEGG